jgi:hypothetical protein
MNMMMKRDAARYGDRDIDAMLQGIGVPEDAPDDVVQPPATVIKPASVVQPAAVFEPVTRFGAPNVASVVPGQSDADLRIYLMAWMTTKKRKAKAATLVYAGVLGSTAPKQGDYPDAEAYQVAYSQWLNRCTDLQRSLLKTARKRKVEMRRANERADYAQMVMDERGVAVREYVTGLSPEDGAERQRKKSAEKQKRYRDRKRAAHALE